MSLLSLFLFDEWLSTLYKNEIRPKYLSTSMSIDKCMYVTKKTKRMSEDLKHEHTCINLHSFSFFFYSLVNYHFL